MTSLRETDCKDLVAWFHKYRAFWGHAVRAEFVEDDPDRGPVYSVLDASGRAVGYGWFGADGNPKGTRRAPRTHRTRAPKYYPRRR